MMPALVAGSRFPVGSSASRMAGLLTMARAIATRCCSPPESSCGKRPCLPARPTILSTSGTASWMKPLLLPITCRANATLSNTVLLRQQPEVLEDDAEAAPEVRHLAARQVVELLPEHVELALAGLLLLEHEAQEAGLSGAGRAHEEDELAP